MFSRRSAIVFVEEFKDAMARQFERKKQEHVGMENGRGRGAWAKATSARGRRACVGGGPEARVSGAFYTNVFHPSPGFNI